MITELETQKAKKMTKITMCLEKEMHQSKCLKIDVQCSGLSHWKSAGHLAIRQQPITRPTEVANRWLWVRHSMHC